MITALAVAVSTNVESPGQGAVKMRQSAPIRGRQGTSGPAQQLLLPTAFTGLLRKHL